VERRAAVVALVAAAWIVFAAAVYLPDVGRGFVKDDFGWIAAGQRAARAPAAALLEPRIGFYRPLVDLTFAADTAAHGMNPRGYGLTNLALYAACVAAIWILGRALGLSAEAAAFGALVWAVNPHGINMALVWISGRTSLCLTLCAVLSAIALLKEQHAWMAVAVLGALASKEEAVALPFILLAWHALLMKDGAARWRATVGVLAPLAVYAALRTHASAFTPGSAPPYYRFSFAPAAVLRNAVEYLDRGATIAVVATLIAAAALRVRPRLAGGGRLLAACAIWFAAGYALTVLLPIRSSLYAVFPSVGAAIAGAALVEGMMRSPDIPRSRVVLLAAAMAMVALLAIPVYRARNGRYAQPARFSDRALHAIAEPAAAAPAGAAIVLHDVDDPLASFVAAFGSFASDAVKLESGRELNVWIDPPPGGWQLAGLHPPAPGTVAFEFGVDRGRIVRMKP
jgi:hypothetical protein